MIHDLKELVQDFVSKQEMILDWAALELPQELLSARALKDWIARGYHGEMHWMEQTLELRTHPRSWDPDMTHAMLFLWKTPQALSTPTGDACVASYAQGEDYHRTLGSTLYQFAEQLQTFDSEFRYRVFCDAQPVAERELAQLSGLGWRGKNTMLIHPRLGSSWMIGGLLCNQAVVHQGPMAPNQEHCGACRRCIDACPTQALGDDGFLNANRCISYTTIEFKGEFSDSQKQSLGPWIFGCDACQVACPWNHKHMAKADTTSYWPDTKQAWQILLEPGSGLNNRIKKTPLSRIGKRGLIRNLKIQ